MATAQGWVRKRLETVGSGVTQEDRPESEPKP
jgi:hypothetical protein